GLIIISISPIPNLRSSELLPSSLGEVGKGMTTFNKFTLFLFLKESLMTWPFSTIEKGTSSSPTTILNSELKFGPYALALNITSKSSGSGSEKINSILAESDHRPQGSTEDNPRTESRKNEKSPEEKSMRISSRILISVKPFIVIVL